VTGPESTRAKHRAVLTQLQRCWLRSSSRCWPPPAPTALYAIYRGRWGFSSVTTTVAFGIHGLSIPAGLLTVGRLSDHIGRRPLLLASLATLTGLLRGVERVDPTLEAAAFAGHECGFSECLGEHGSALVAGDELDGEIAGVLAAH